MSRYLGREYLQPDPAILSGTSSPDGVVSAQKGTLFVNTATGSVWQNTDGATMWRTFGTQQFAFQSGRVYFVPRAAANSSNATTNGVLRVSPFCVPNQVTVSRIGAEVTVAGDSGSKVRLGIYADDGTGRPGNLVVDAGQIAGDSATVQGITLGTPVTIGPGIYWAAWAVQSVTSVSPTLRTNQDIGMNMEAGTSDPTTGLNVFGFLQNSVTGALPSTWGSSYSVSGLGVRLFLKVQ